MLARSFPPIAAPDARLLILGSMPGVASLDAQRYYAHPRNAFWPIMGELFGAGSELPYEDRCERLKEQGVAVWDVLRSCRREGSLDTSIERETEEPNDFAEFFANHPEVHRVGFNGQKAETAFRRHVLKQLPDELVAGWPGSEASAAAPGALEKRPPSSFTGGSASLRPRPPRRLQFVRLPSTSPAHAGRSFEEKLEAWRVELVG